MGWNRGDFAVATRKVGGYQYPIRRLAVVEDVMPRTAWVRLLPVHGDRLTETHTMRLRLSQLEPCTAAERERIERMLDQQKGGA